MLVSFLAGNEGFGLILKNLGACGIILAIIIGFFVIKIDGEPIITAAEWASLTQYSQNSWLSKK